MSQELLRSTSIEPGEDDQIIPPGNLVLQTWQCDICNFMNPISAFPCGKCRYPIEIPSPNDDGHEEFDGFQTRDDPRVGAMTADDALRLETEQLEEAEAASKQGFDLESWKKQKIPGVVGRWQCPQCTLVMDHSPCMFCGYQGEDQLSEKTDQDTEQFMMALEAQVVVIEAEGMLSQGSWPIDESRRRWKFRVSAPNAFHVKLGCSFDGWCMHQMQREQDGKHWQIVIDGVRAGDTYKYLIYFKHRDRGKTTVRSVWRADPYSSVLTINQYGEYDSMTYDHDEYQWHHPDFICPQTNELVLYETHIASFGASPTKEFGDFMDCIKHLSYLKQLGVNCIALLPVTMDRHPTDKDNFVCWGYDPVSLFAIQPTYGTPNDLKAFIDAAHGNGIAVIFDFVPNHMSSRTVLQYFDGTNMYFAENGTPWGPRPDFSKEPVRHYIVEAVLSFFRDYHFDGVRVDSTSNVRGTPEEHKGGWDMLQAINDAVHEHFPNAITIAEDLYDDDRLNGGVACFDLQWANRFFHTVRHNAIAYADKDRNMDELAEAIRYRHPGPMGGRLLYIENHDTVCEAREKRTPNAIIQGLDGRDLEKNFYAIKRTTLSIGLMLTSPGVPMICQGLELFETSCPNWPKGFYVDWDRIDRMPGFFMFVCDAIRVRKNVDGFTAGLAAENVHVHHINNDKSVLAFHRWSQGGAGDDVMVFVNFSNKDFKSYRIGFPRLGQWRVRLNSHDSKYEEVFNVVKKRVPDQIESVRAPRDGYPFSASIPLPRYTILALSQDPLAFVVFRIRADLNPRKYGVAITGSLRELGSWQDIHTLTTNVVEATHPWWQSQSITLPAFQDFEFKAVVTDHDGNVVSWEDRANRVVRPKRGRQVIVLVPEFDPLS